MACSIKDFEKSTHLDGIPEVLILFIVHITVYPISINFRFFTKGYHYEHTENPSVNNRRYREGHYIFPFVGNVPMPVAVSQFGTLDDRVDNTLSIQLDVLDKIANPANIDMDELFRNPFSPSLFLQYNERKVPKYRLIDRSFTLVIYDGRDQFLRPEIIENVKFLFLKHYPGIYRRCIAHLKGGDDAADLPGEIETFRIQATVYPERLRFDCYLDGFTLYHVHNPTVNNIPDKVYYEFPDVDNVPLTLQGVAVADAPWRREDTGFNVAFRDDDGYVRYPTRADIPTRAFAEYNNMEDSSHIPIGYEDKLDVDYPIYDELLEHADVVSAQPPKPRQMSRKVQRAWSQSGSGGGRGSGSVSGRRSVSVRGRSRGRESRKKQSQWQYKKNKSVKRI
jgi:hypothetical protein